MTAPWDHSLPAAGERTTEPLGLSRALCAEVLSGLTAETKTLPPKLF